MTIFGNGFDSLGGMAHDAGGQAYEPSCRFNAVNDKQMVVLMPLFAMNGTHAVCLVPAVDGPGRYNVQLSLNGEHFEGEIPYEYLSEPTITKVHPTGGPLSGGTLITLTGHGFRTIDQEDSYLEQWASDATARSQYSDSVGSALQATGAPNGEACGDDVVDPHAWMPNLGTDVPDWLQVTFERPVRAWRWRIFMSSRASAVKAVELIDLLGRRRPASFNASAQLAGTCACAGRASDGCSAVVEAHLNWRDQPLVVGLRVSTVSDGWEGIDAVQLAGYAETQHCKLGTHFVSLLEQSPVRIVCATPSHAETRLVVNATSTQGAYTGKVGFYYPLYLTPPNVSHHAHTFAEYPGMTFYMPDHDAHHAEASLQPHVASSLVMYSRGSTQAASGTMPAQGASDDCRWARDGLCDEPPFCAHSTDCTDCGQCSSAVFVVPVELSFNGRDGRAIELRQGASTVNDSLVAFTYYPLARILTLWPRATLADGGTIVTIHGDGFNGLHNQSATKCRFGHAIVPARRLDDSHVVCEVPEIRRALHPPRAADSGADDAFQTDETLGSEDDVHVGSLGMAQVSLTLNDQDYQQVGEVHFFRFSLDGIRPSGGPSGGGTLITLLGHGFNGADVHSTDRERRCLFRFSVPAGSGSRKSGYGASGYLVGGSDGLAADWPEAWEQEMPVLSLSSHRIECVTPAAPHNFTGQVDVLLTLNGLDYTNSAPPYFTYYALHLTSISPRGGPARGGTSVVVSGLSLNAFGTLDQTLCRFGDPGFVVRASARDNTSIVCTAPSSCDPLSSANEICDTGPRHISPFRRTAVRMAGESFHLSQPSVNQSSWGARKLFVSVNGQDFSGVADHGALSYLYYPLPTLTKVQPNGGPVQSPEGSVVFVHGSGFNALRDALRSSLAAGTESSTASEQCNDPARSSDHDEVVWCRFGTTTTSLSVPAVSFNDSVVECPLPKRHGAGDVVVQVSLNGLDWSGTSASHEDASMEEARNEAGGDFSRGVRRGELTGGTLLFSFFEPPIINRISPTTGHVTGGIHVTLYGARFDVYGELWQTRCRFGVDEIAAVSKSPTEIVCPLPPTSVPRSPDRQARLHPQRAVERVSASIDGGFSWTVQDSNAPLEMQRYDAVSHRLEPNAGPARGGFTLRVHGDGMLAIPLPEGSQSTLPSSSALNTSPSGGEVLDEARCAFGTDVRPATRRTDRWVECIVPPVYGQLTSGRRELAVRVRVSLRGGDYVPDANASSPLKFLYYPEPSVRDIGPASGPSSGGTELTVVGDFPAGLRLESTMCRIGERSVPAAAASTSEIRCRTPPYTPGTGTSVARVPVSLSFNQGANFADAAPPLTFLYYVMAVSACSPLGGPTAGDTSLSVRGVGFNLGGNATGIRAKLRRHGGSAPEAKVELDLGAAASVSLGGAVFTMLPTTAPGLLTIRITLNALGGYPGDYLGGETAPVLFRTYLPPVVSSLSPAIGPIRGGTMLTLRGAGFDAFGELPAAPTIDVTSATRPGEPYVGYVVDGMLSKDLTLLRGVTYRFNVDARMHPFILTTIAGPHCLQGELTEAQGVSNSRVEQGVLIFTPDARTPSPLFYQDLAQAKLSIPLAEGRRQTIRLVTPGGGCSLRVGGARLTPLARNESTVELRMPSAASQGYSTVDVSLNGQQFEAPTTFYFHTDPVVSTLYPSSGPSAGGTTLQLIGSHLALPTSVRDSIVDPPLPSFLLNGTLVPVRHFAPDGGLLNLTLPPLPLGEHRLRLTLTGRERDVLDTGMSVVVWAPILAADAATGTGDDGTTTAAASAAAAGSSVTVSSSSVGSATSASTGGTTSAATSTSTAGTSGTVDPSGGPVGGGTMVSILTATLSQGLAACCVFGDPTSAACVDAQIVRGYTDKTDKVRCPAPSVPSPGFVRLGLSLNGGVDVNALGNYLYTQISLGSLTPTSASTSGGTMLTISGSGLLALGIAPSAARCRFTYETAQPTPDGLGASRVRDVPLVALRDEAAECERLPTCGCAVPANGCSISVGFVRNGIDVEGALPLTCYAPITVLGVSPAAGPVGGGTIITVGGGPFAQPGPAVAAHCRIGSAIVTAMATENQIICAATPPVPFSEFTSSAAQPVRISLNAQDYSPDVLGAPNFTFYTTPYVQRIRPTAGPVLGGTAITLKGLHLAAGGWASAASLALQLGADGASPQAMTSTSLDSTGAWIVTNLTAPAPSSCASLCCVLNADGSSPISCDAGTLAADAAGSAATACAACVRPIGFALNGVNYDWPHPPVPFTFYHSTRLVLREASPRSGPVNGGTEVTLHGSGLTPAGAFAEDAMCGFGLQLSADGSSQPMQSSRVLRADGEGRWIVCGPTKPFDVAALAAGGAQAPYQVAVTIAPNGINFETGATVMHLYLYLEPTPIFMLPSGGPLSGGTTILVGGTGLLPGPHTDASLARCRYGRREPGAVTNVSSVDASGVRCFANPPTTQYMIGADKGLQVALNGQQFAPAAPGLPFRYYVQPVLSAIWPTGGPAAGGSPVTLYGLGFDRFEASTLGRVESPADAEGTGAPLCLFGGECYDSEGVHRGLACAQPPRVTSPDHPLAASALVRNATRIVCVAPTVTPLPPPGQRSRTSVRVAIALNAQNFVHARTPLFVFYSGVLAHTVEPLRGPPMGGIEVRVTGTHFNVFGETKDARCRFSSWVPLVAAAGLGMDSAGSCVADIAPLFKEEDHIICRTPRCPAGTAQVEVSLNGKDFHGHVPPLTHRFACEQHAPRDLFSCVADHSCGHCNDQLPPAHFNFTEYGITQDRMGCAVCHAEGCAAGPAEGRCRLWTYETRILEPPADSAQARGLEIANVSLPFDGNESARAHGWLLPDQMRYFRVRPPHASVRILISASSSHGDINVVARRHIAPGAGQGEHELISSRNTNPQLLIIPQDQIRCDDATNAAGDTSFGAVGTSTPVCEEWVIGILGNAWRPRGMGDFSPPHELSDFNLTVRTEIVTPHFACEECAHDCAACGWLKGHATQFLREAKGKRVVARLTNGTNQVGTLWAAAPQPYSAGFEAQFTFRISEASVCTQALEAFGANTTATAEHAGKTFVPIEELKAKGQDITHYLIDHPSLPFEQLPPPRGMPPQLAGSNPGVPVNPSTRYGEHSRTATGARGPYLGLKLGCPPGVERVGGEGFAFVMQSVGLDAAGCAGTGVGYAGATGCARSGLARSLAIQFDTHHNARTVRRETCIDTNSETGKCQPGALKVTESLTYDRQHAVSVFLGGDNGAGKANVTYLLSHNVQSHIRRFDRGEVHRVRIVYNPPLLGGDARGRLELYLDSTRWVTFSLPITLPHVDIGGDAHPGTVSEDADGVRRTYVGFTASTGEASEWHDILDFSFCHKLGCAVL